MNALDHRRIFEDTHNIWRQFRNDMRRNVQYTLGVQYTREDKNYIANQGRQEIAWNIVMPKILAFIGEERSNRIWARAEARDTKDLHIASIINTLLEQDNDATNAIWQLSLAATDAAITRYGALYAGWEITNDYPEGQYVLKALDPFDVWMDYTPHERDFDKSNYIIFSRWFTADQIISKYTHGRPELAEEIEEAALKVEGLAGRQRRSRSFAEKYRVANSEYFTLPDKAKFSDVLDDNYTLKTYNEYAKPTEGFYRVIEFHERRFEECTIINDYKRGRVQQIPDTRKTDREWINQTLALMGLDERAVSTAKLERMYQSVSAPHFTNELLYDEPYAVQGAGFAIKVLPCYNLTADRRELRSIVDTQIDPQDLMNRDLMSRALLMNQALNPSWIVGRSAFDDESELEQLKDRYPGGVKVFNRPELIRPVYPEMGLVNLFTGSSQNAMTQSELTPGIGRDLMGVKSGSEDTGRLIATRISQSQSMLTATFDNVTQTLLAVEKYHLGIIQTHMTIPRMIRTVGPGQDAEFQMMINEPDYAFGVIKNDVTVGKFDVRIDKTKYTKTEKQLQRDQLIQIMQMSDPATRQRILPELFKILDIPQSPDLVAFAEKQLKVVAGQQELQMLQIGLQVMNLQMQIQAAQNPQPQAPPPPKLTASINYRDLPPEQKNQLAAQAGIIEPQAEQGQEPQGMPPEVQKVISQMSPEQQEQFMNLPKEEQMKLLQSLMQSQPISDEVKQQVLAHLPEEARQQILGLAPEEQNQIIQQIISRQE